MIYRTAEKTNSYSLFVNNQQCYWKATRSVIQRLTDVHDRGATALESLDSYRERVSYAKAIYRPPRNLAMVAFLLRVTGRIVRRVVVERMTEEHWSIAWRRLPQSLPDVPTTAGEPFRLLESPRGFSMPIRSRSKCKGGITSSSKTINMPASRC